MQAKLIAALALLLVLAGMTGTIFYYRGQSIQHAAEAAQERAAAEANRLAAQRLGAELTQTNTALATATREAEARRVQSNRIMRATYAAPASTGCINSPVAAAYFGGLRDANAAGGGAASGPTGGAAGAVSPGTAPAPDAAQRR